MTHYLVQLREIIFVEGYGFLSFVINMGKNKNKNLSGKYSQKNFLIMLNNLQQIHLKLLQKE